MRRAAHFALFCLVATGCPAGEDDTDTGNPDDPTDPHFQAVSVADVDRKGLLLSPPTREAIERLRR